MLAAWLLPPGFSYSPGGPRIGAAEAARGYLNSPQMPGRAPAGYSQTAPALAGPVKLDKAHTQVSAWSSPSIHKVSRPSEAVVPTRAVLEPSDHQQ